MRTFALALLVIVSTACAGPTGGAQQQQIEFAVAAVEDNMLATDYTALVEITGVRAIQVAQASEEMLRIEYAATVLEAYLGEERTEIVFSRYSEPQEGSEDPARGKLVVSLCRDRDGSYYLPGVGYELPPDDAVVDRARQTKARIAAGELSLRRDEASYACAQ